jgi:signal peptidase I
MRRVWIVATAVIAALVLSSIVRLFLFQTFLIPSESMDPTLAVGERVAVSKLATHTGDINRGDIVVFRDPGAWLPGELGEGRSSISQFLSRVGVLPQDTGQDLVKRIIGVGGDRIECCSADGRIRVNGQVLTETYVDPQVGSAQVFFNQVVPPGSYFVMGDNRDRSADSRYHLVEGTWAVPQDLVVGKVIAVAWPFGQRRVIEGSAELAELPDSP